MAKSKRARPKLFELSELVFVGFNSRVAALDRNSGHLVWEWKASAGSGFVALLLDGEQLIVSVNGYTYALDALTGEERWWNEMKGFGYGVPCLASINGSSVGWSLLGGSAQRRRNERARRTREAKRKLNHHLDEIIEAEIAHTFVRLVGEEA